MGIRYRTAEVVEAVGELRFRLASLESFEEAVDETYRQLEAKGRPELLESLCPYFGFLWPGARVLARWLWEQGPEAFSGRRVLEVGCGLALPSFVAARLGAEVTASDHHPDVPVFLARNLELNPGTTMSFRRLDWNEDVPAASFDWIVGSDVLYESAQADALLKLVTRALRPGGQTVLLDPNRPFWERLVVLARQRGLQARVERLTPRHADEPASSALIRLSR